jgi:hypothetical protein
MRGYGDCGETVGLPTQVATALIEDEVADLQPGLE